MKKILFLTGNINNSGGTERVLSLIANNLVHHGYSIEIACIQRGDNPYFEIDNDIIIHSLYKTSGRVLFRLPFLIFKLRNLIKKNKYDIVITVETMGVFISIPSLLGLKTRHICWEHFNFNNDNGVKNRKLARHLAAKHCNDIVTLTERDKEFWINGTNLQANITAIPNPLTFPIQNTHKYPINSKILLAIGRPIHTKGYDRLLTIWKEIHYTIPEWKLEIVGLNEEERNKLTKICIQLDISMSVNLVPPTKNISSFYEKAAIYCLTSRYEGFPMVLLETLAFGVPVISFDCDTGPAEILDDTDSILIKNDDSKKFSEELLKMIQSPDLRLKISKQAQKKSEKYAINHITQQWLNLIDKKH